MSLNSTDLEAVRAWAERHIKEDDRRQRLSPLYDALRMTMEETTRQIPAMMAGPTAQVRRSVLSMEGGLEEFADKAIRSEQELQALLDGARRRTAMLSDWLEELS